ncbi:hypothetical protein [Pseudoduganella sp. OTU4001]|uniref:hypothetical protein n=1 Tax=Pseudoduganella sp. OTU4001 TaxID=3043854 RepID=UPI00313D9BBE
MRTIYSDRRLDGEQNRHLDHAVDLVRTHGWHYAVVYLRNQHIPDAIIQRVLFGDWQRRRVSANKLVICQRLQPGGPVS